MIVLVAPDKFKDALDARAVAAAISTGVCDAWPDAQTMLCPLGDGGEGTGGLLAAALRAKPRAAEVCDPLGRVRRATWWYRADTRCAVVEMAEASGLALLAPNERNALRASSYGTGQLIRAAIDGGAERVLVCVGGSATVDGGMGCLQALGWRLRDLQGSLLPEPISGGRLAGIGAMEPPARRASAKIEVLCDVDNPLLGSRGAAAVFGPQKGADAAGVKTLAEGLENVARLLTVYSGHDVAALPGSGAAGGLPAALVAALGAELRNGFDEVAAQVDLRSKLAACDLCLTGEGRIDVQTAAGKVVAGVARLGREVGVPVVALTGSLQLDAGQTAADAARAPEVARIIVITPEGMTLTAALAATERHLRQAASQVCAAWNLRE